MGKLITVSLSELRPNNWYINRAKLDKVREAWRNGRQDALPPVLVTLIDGELSLIDGHSRCLAAFENGGTEIKADLQALEEIGGSRTLYEHIHREGPRRDIANLTDLATRIVEPDEHRSLWIGYCTRWLEENQE